MAVTMILEATLTFMLLIMTIIASTVLLIVLHLGHMVSRLLKIVVKVVLVLMGSRTILTEA